MSDWLGIVVQGILTGGLYALFAAGLSMSFGILRIVNLAHGDLIVLACFVALMVVETLGLPALTSFIFVVPAMFALGYALQQGLLNRVIGNGELPPLLTTFGLSIVIQNSLLELFSADNRKLQAGAIEVQSLDLLPGVTVGWLPLLMFLCAVVLLALLHALFFRTRLGRAFRAAADDPRTLSHMGYEPKRIYALAMGTAMAVCAVAAVFMAVRTQFTPLSGPARLLFAFEAVIIGGMGSIWGTFLGALLLGVAQAVGAALDPVLETLAGHVLFFILLLLRPQGLIAKGK
ncbi:branched-chain amino acid ABC transporter permease [Uliginosibacterium sediminicola]|uniref:Branched-chain amino acid ABC transporter permease n=1 Tax=Uliginosibacterium sediminicola TaxID=2024550 RepID=A0ABU9YXY4_9RHOO